MPPESQNNLPHFFRDKSPQRRAKYEAVKPRVTGVHNNRAFRNLSKLIFADWRDNVKPNQLKNMMADIVTGKAIHSRLEPKSEPGKFRELWIPQDKLYTYVLDALSYILQSLSTSPETVAFRKGLAPAKGLRGMIDEYETACEQKDLPKKQNAKNEGYIIGTCYQADIKNYYGSITFDQVAAFLRTRITQLLQTVLPEEECHELADIIADLVCPGEVLPQGFATSPAIANGIGVGIDRRLRQGVRAVLGESGISVIGRYADDLVVMTSAEFNERILGVMGNAVAADGLRLHPGKFRFTRAVEEDPGKRSSAIDIWGMRMRNDGDGPLRFGPLPAYVHDMESAVRWLLDCNLKDVKTFDQITGARGWLAKVLGGMGYIHDILRWGTPEGTRLREGQKHLLPRELDRLWAQLREKLQDVLTSRQKDLHHLRNQVMRKTEDEKIHKSLGDILQSNFGHLFEIDADEENPRFCIKNKNTGEVVLEVTRESLRREGFPQNPEEIESYLLEEVEKILKKKIQLFISDLKTEKIGNYNNLKNPEHKEFWKRYTALYFEFLKWRFAVLLNIPGLQKEKLENFFDTDEIAVNEETGKVETAESSVFPWGIGELFQKFEKLAKEIDDGRTRVFGFPLEGGKVNKITRVYVRNRKKPFERLRRDGKGTYVALPKFKLETKSGFALKEQKKFGPKKKDDDGTPSDGSQSADTRDGSIFTRETTTRDV